MTTQVRVNQTANHLIGSAFVSNLELEDRVLDALLALTIATAAAVFVLGNLLLMNGEALASSAAIGLVSVGLLLLLFGLARLTRSLGWGLALTYAFLSIAAVDPSMSSRAVLIICACVAGFFMLRRIDLPEAKSLVGVGIVAAIAILGSRDSYTSFDMLQRARIGDVHQDTAFHASIAAMVKNYGVVSTGLNGLVETPYHFLSHLLLAGISRLSGQGVLEVYGVASWVMFAPVLILGVVSLCVALRPATARGDTIWLWGATVLLFALTPYLLSRWALWDHFWISESYLVSLGLFLAGLPLLFKRALRIQDVALAVALAVMMALAKATVGLVFVGLWFTRALFLRSGNERSVLATASISMICVAWFVSASATASGDSISVRPLDFIQYSSLGRYVEAVRSSVQSHQTPKFPELALAAIAVISFVVVHFWASWAVILLTTRRLGWRSVFTSPIALYSLAATGAGLVVVLLFAIPGGSAGYFSTVAFFVSAPVIAAGAANLLKDRFRSGTLFVVTMILVSMVSVEGLQRASVLSRRGATPEIGKSFVETLVGWRDAPRDAVLIANPSLLDQNPTTRCISRPFIFPALSEHPWVNVIEPVSKAQCDYSNFGFNQYRLSGEQQLITHPPVLPAGSRLQPAQ